MDLELILLSASKHFYEGNLDCAQGLYSKAIKFYPQDPRAYYERGVKFNLLVFV